MATDYGTINYLEQVGGHVHIHYDDGKVIDSFPDGRGRYLPATVNTTPPPDPDPDPDPPPTGSGTWTHPAPGAVLTSPYGDRGFDFHYGIDVSSTTAPVGVPCVAVCDMVITRAYDAYEGGNESAGTYIKGHATDGSYSFGYYHGADGSLAVAAGQTVTKGTTLFMEGATGNVTGTHLHFELCEGVWDDAWPPPYNNGAVFPDPIPVLNSKGVTVP